MLDATVKAANHVTEFLITPQKNGGYRVTEELDGFVKRETFCLTPHDAGIMRGIYINQFWGNRLN